MNQISSIVALVGVIFVAASVYFFEEKPLPPEDFSKSHVVPIVIGFATLALISSYWHPLSATLVNGFVILALVGSIYRTFTWLRF